jgi:hypothetical protein
MSNRRKYFEKYASDHGFDPLIPDNWYTTRVEALEYKKVIYFYSSKWNIKHILLGRSYNKRTVQWEHDSSSPSCISRIAVGRI